METSQIVCLPGGTSELKVSTSAAQDSGWKLGNVQPDL